MSPNDWEPYLTTICQAVRFEHTDACTFGGRQLEIDSIAEADAPRRQTVSGGELAEPDDREPSPLAAALTLAIYQQCFARRFNGVWPARAHHYDPDYIPDAHFATRLSAANQSRTGWDPGWEICHLGAERDVQVRNGDRYRTVPPGQYAFTAGPGLLPRPSDLVSLLVLRESTQLQPGFYFAFGETLSDQFDTVDSVRFYFHLDPEGTPELIEQLTTVLNRFQVPFEFKCQKYRENYDRLDAAVLYIARRDFDLTYRLVMELASGMRRYFGEAVPLFTRRSCTGISVADDPHGACSFGQVRCELVAGALLDVRTADAINPQAFLGALKHRFERAGLSFERPYLNAGSADMFDAAPALERAP